MPIEADRRALRLGLGSAAVFIAAVAFTWPLSVVAAVLTATLLQGSAPLGGRLSLGLVATAFGILAVALVVYSLLKPYPALFLLAVAVGMAMAFAFAAKGASSTLVVLILLGTSLLPYVIQQSQDVAAALVIWLPVDLVIALLVMHLAFLLIPPDPHRDRQAARDAALQAAFDPGRRQVRMVLVAVPFTLAFLLIEGGYVVTLLYVAILSQQLVAATGTGLQVAKGMLLSNLAAGLAAIVAHELLVMVPIFPALVLVSVLMCLMLARWAAPALSTALILLGGTMTGFGGEADVAMVDRLVQVAVALAYVLGAFVVVDRFLPEREIPPEMPSWRGRTGRRGRARGPRAPAPRA